MSITNENYRYIRSNKETGSPVKKIHHPNFQNLIDNINNPVISITDH